MQLHSTEWLGESWGKQDIFFLQTSVKARGVGGKSVVIVKPVIDNPFVRRTFETSNRSSYAQHTASISIRSPLVQYDKNLFSLGLVLVELWYRKRLEDLRSSNNNQLHDHLDYTTAVQRIKEIEDQAGPMYSTAVRRCIRRLDCTVQSLDNEGFKEQVHEQVMSQLELNWRQYEVGYNA
jgi:hypothetical protein